MTKGNMVEQPSVSIMIPTYNQKRFVGKAIESALAQDYQNLEIIVSDDCSGDGTEQAVKPYLQDRRLRYFRNSCNLGRVANYRHTLKHLVSGTWVLNLDGDDFLYDGSVISHAIEERLRHSDENIVVIFGIQETRKAALEIRTTLPEHPECGLFNGIDVFRRWPRIQYGHLATLYNAKIAREIDYYRLDTISSDWESVLRLLLHGRALIVNRLIGVWNIHGDNVSASASITSWIRDYGYIEEAAAYASRHGLSSSDRRAWLRAMVRFHTKHIWNSDFPTPVKMRELPPFLLGRYPFALSTLLHPAGIARNVLRLQPGLYRKCSYFFRQQRRKASAASEGSSNPKFS